MRYFVKKVFQAKAYKKKDSASEVQIANLNKIIYRDSIQKIACDTLLKEKDKTSSLLTQNVKDLKDELRSKDVKITFWKVISGLLTIIGGGYIIHDKISN